MKRLVKDKVLTVKVVDKESSRSVVELTDASGTPVINVSSLLLEEGFAAEELSMALPAARGSDVEQAKGEYEHVLLPWHCSPPLEWVQRMQTLISKSFSVWLIKSSPHKSKVYP